MTEAPDDWIELDDGRGRKKFVMRKTLEREATEADHPCKSDVYSASAIQVANRQYHLGKVYKPRDVPLNHPDAPHTDKMGRCVFTNSSEEREFMRKTGATNDGRKIEAGELHDAGGAAPLPYDKAWKEVKKKATELGHLPLPGETRRDAERRQTEVLKRMDRNERERRTQQRAEGKRRRRAGGA